MKITLSKKQHQLLNSILSTEEHEIEVLGSTQSGKTFLICLGCILYAQELYKYDPDKEYQGAIVGWTIDTLKSNIVENITNLLNGLGYKNKQDYTIVWGSNDEKYLKIWNMKYFFFGFNNVTSFNKILGKPLIFEWIDESARIYTQSKLQESFDEFPGRQVSFANHPYLKTIHSFNVEGSERHPYKVKYIDNKPNATHYTFYPYDNPVLNTAEAIRKVKKMFSTDTLRRQKIYNEWVVAEGRVFNEIPVIDSLGDRVIRDIGIGIDYGSVNPTTFVPIALCWCPSTNKWEVIRLGIYYHDPNREQDNPTTEYYSNQLRLFLKYLGDLYPHKTLTNIVIDSEASHFDNRLITDGIMHELSKKGAGSVNEGVEHLQSLFNREFLKIMDTPSIRYFDNNGKPVFSGKDEGLIELESYRYDSVKSTSTGINCYVKEQDHCLTGDTLISTPKGNIPIKELVNTKGKVYCYNGDKIVASNYYNCKMTQQNVDIYELELSNGYKIKGTYDHPVLTKNGYVMLGELKDTDEVVCVY